MYIVEPSLITGQLAMSDPPLVGLDKQVDYNYKARLILHALTMNASFVFSPLDSEDASLTVVPVFQRLCPFAYRRSDNGDQGQNVYSFMSLLHFERQGEDESTTSPSVFGTPEMGGGVGDGGSE